MKKSFFEEGYVGLIGVSMIGAVSFELFYLLAILCVFYYDWICFQLLE